MSLRSPVAEQSYALVRQSDANSWVRPEALNVTPDLLGAPLARPSRRAFAIAIDCVVVALLSSTGTFWVPAAAAALIFQMRRRHAAHAPMSNWLWLALAALVCVAGWHMVDYIERHQADPKGAIRAVTDDDDDDAADLADASAALGALAGRAASMPAAASNAAAHALAAASAALSDPQRRAEEHAAQRIAKLEAEIAELRKPRTTRWRDEAVKAIHSIGLGFGWAVAYFTLLPLWWQGQTLGKKMLGLRIVPLAGKAMGPLAWFGRYGGYAAGMATGGVGFAQVLWDPNRQAIQDKIAHTVVVDLKAPYRPAPTADPVAIATPEAAAALLPDAQPGSN